MNGPSQSQVNQDPTAAISVRGLVNRFGSQTVHDGLDLDVRRGEILGVVGGSGTGKSVLMRTILSNLTHVADHAIAEGKFRKAWSMHIVWGTVLYSLMYFIPIFLSVYFGTDLVQKIVAFIPAWLTDGLNLGSKFLTAYGIALLLSTMLNRDLTVYFLLGFFFVGYLGLDITAVAIFAAILAVILTGLKYGKGAPAAAAAGAAAANPDYDPLEDDDDL